MQWRLFCFKGAHYQRFNFTKYEFAVKVINEGQFLGGFLKSYCRVKKNFCHSPIGKTVIQTDSLTPPTREAATNTADSYFIS